MLFNGFQAVNNLKVTKIAEQMGLTKQQQVEDRLRLAVIEAYCNVLYYTELGNVIRAQVSTAEKSMLSAQRQYELGQKSYSDVLHTKAELSDREYQLTICSNQLDNAYITLTDIMLYDNKKVLNIDLEWPDSLSEETASGSEFEASRAMQAVGKLPRVIIANGELETARIALKTAKWRLLPSLSLYGGWSSTYFTYPGKAGYVPAPYWHQIGNNGGEYVQLSLSIPIYDRLSQQSEIVRRRNALDRAEARREQAMHEADAEVRRAIADRDGAAEALQQAEHHAVLQQELYTLSTRQFEQGLISAIEYQTVADNHLSATAEYLHARLTYFVTCEVVRYYAGLLMKN
jgi:outer membrane protein TolC